MCSKASDRLQRLKALLERHEGRRATAYRDTMGVITIGVGRNLVHKGLSDAEIDMLLDHDLAEIRQALQQRVPGFETLDDVRQAVLIDMAFNLGLQGLLGFKRTLLAVQRGDYQAAARGMLASKWALQVKGRATELAAMMRSGEWPAGIV
jgi:lysozyme